MGLIKGSQERESGRGRAPKLCELRKVKRKAKERENPIHFDIFIHASSSAALLSSFSCSNPEAAAPLLSSAPPSLPSMFLPQHV